jgi:putative transposase
LDENSKLAKCLYNAALFRIRQIFTGWDKTSRTDNEAEVFAEVSLLMKTYPKIRVRRVISYLHLEKLMRVTKNPDFFSGLPMQSAQEILKQAVRDFKNWLEAMKDYKKNPDKYLGKPGMPKYKKAQITTWTMTNQDVVLYPAKDTNGSRLKFPRTKTQLMLPHVRPDANLKEAKVTPYYDRYILSLTFETKAPAFWPDMPETAAIDFGTDNIAAIVCTDGSSRVYKGGAVLSENQWFAKARAKAVGIITKGHNSMYADSRYLRDLSFHHANFNRDQVHKISTDIVRYCVEHRAGTLVLGVNKYWKQESTLGLANNQKFVSVPITLLRGMITYKAQTAGIVIIEQEESYTSMADIIAMDYIPTYGVDDASACFSGKRLKRGLYQCCNGLLINADCNGAANIMRKAIPDVWKDRSDFTFLAFPESIGFQRLNPKYQLAS